MLKVKNWSISVAIVLVIVVSFFVYLNYDPITKHVSAVESVTEKRYFTTDEIDFLILDCGYQVWEYRQGLIHEAFENKEFTESEAKELVNSIASNQ